MWRRTPEVNWGMSFWTVRTVKSQDRLWVGWGISILKDCDILQGKMGKQAVSWVFPDPLGLELAGFAFWELPGLDVFSWPCGNKGCLWVSLSENQFSQLKCYSKICQRCWEYDRINTLIGKLSLLQYLYFLRNFFWMLRLSRYSFFPPLHSLNIEICFAFSSFPEDNKLFELCL